MRCVLLFLMMGLISQSAFGDVMIVPQFPADALPTILNPPSDAGRGTARTVRTGETNAARNQYEAVGQVLSLSENWVGLQSLFLQVAQGRTIPSDGTHALEILVGTWDGDAFGDPITSQVFDVAGKAFQANDIIQFNFAAPFNLKQGDNAFQVWWTTADASHDLSWQLSDGQGTIDGQWISKKGRDVALPFDARLTGDRKDLMFAFQQIPEPSTFITMLIGFGMFLRIYRGCNGKGRGAWVRIERT